MKRSNHVNAIYITTHRKLYSNSVYDVFADDILDSYGNNVADYLSVEAKITDPELITGVCVLPFEGEKVGLINIFRHPQSRSSLEAIKGHIETAEAFITSTQRKLLEESGFDCDLGRLHHAGYVAPEAGLFKGRTAIYFADISGLEVNSYTVEIGHSDLHFFSPSEVDSLMNESQIEDATTLVAILRFSQLLK